MNAGPVRDALKRLVKSSYYLTCATFVIMNYLEGRRYRRGNIDTKSGTLHAGFDASDSVTYIRDVYRDYLEYGGLTHFDGRVAEIGPGDNCGVAMLIAASGAQSVDLVDRFYSARESERQAVIYAELMKDPAVASRFAGASLLDEGTFAGLARHYGQSASAEEFFRDHRGYSSILSRAVMEHLYDPELALDGMAAALAPGGMLLHKVDLRDHGMFTPKFHPLKFLEVPEPIYAKMTRSSGRPNRVLVHHYRAALNRSGLDYKILVTSLAGVGEVRPHVPYELIPSALREESERYVESVRHRFAAPFRNLPVADLAVSGIFLVAQDADGRR